MWKRGMGWTFAVVLGLETPGLAQERETISITVRLRNDAGISESVIGLARAAALKVADLRNVAAKLSTTTLTESLAEIP